MTDDANEVLVPVTETPALPDVKDKQTPTIKKKRARVEPVKRAKHVKSDQKTTPAEQPTPTAIAPIPETDESAVPVEPIPAKKVKHAEDVASPIDPSQRNAAGVRPSSLLLGDSIKSNHIKCLAAAGYFTVERIATMTPKELVLVKGLGDKPAEEITKRARALCALEYACTAWQLHQNQQVVNPNSSTSSTSSTAAPLAITAQGKAFRIKSGCSEIDNALAGGFASKEVTELSGDSATGKSQFCDQMAISGQSAACSGKPGRIMWIDTERTFNAERLCRICDRFGLDFKTVCDNINLKMPLTEQQFDDLLNEAISVIDKEQSIGIPYSCMIVDSFIRPFRAQFEGRGELANRQQNIASCLDRLLRTAVAENIVVLITNQVVGNPDQGPLSKFAPKFKPAGGHVMGHAVNNRLTLRKGGKVNGQQTWVMKTEDVPHLPVLDIAFKITETGIHDPSYDMKLDKKVDHVNAKYESGFAAPHVVTYSNSKKTKAAESEEADALAAATDDSVKATSAAETDDAAKDTKADEDISVLL